MTTVGHHAGALGERPGKSPPRMERGETLADVGARRGERHHERDAAATAAWAADLEHRRRVGSERHTLKAGRSSSPNASAHTTGLAQLTDLGGGRARYAGVQAQRCGYRFDVAGVVGGSRGHAVGLGGAAERTRGGTDVHARLLGRDWAASSRARRARRGSARSLQGDGESSRRRRVGADR